MPRNAGKLFVQVVVLPLIGLLCSRTVLAIAHANGWYPENQLAALLMASPTLIQVEWARWSLLLICALAIWLAAECYFYRGDVLARIRIWMNPFQIENAPGLSWKKNKKGWQAVWVAPANAVRKGWKFKRQRLWQGTPEEPTPNKLVRDWISDICRSLDKEARVWAMYQTNEPRMEQILASTRRIISEDQKAAT